MKSEAHAAQLEAAAEARLEAVRQEHKREVAGLQALLSKEREEKQLLSKRLDQAYFPCPVIPCIPPVREERMLEGMDMP